jgi:hypothetical protein
MGKPRVTRLTRMWNGAARSATLTSSPIYSSASIFIIVVFGYYYLKLKQESPKNVGSGQHEN